MAFKVSDRLPEDCALRRGTLIVGVQKHSPSGIRSEVSDPMQPAVDQIERALRAKVARYMAERMEAEKQSSGSITRMPSDST